MKIQLQKFFHKYTSYARPNQTWACGKQAQGYCCEAGPDAKGFCRTEYECKPYKKEAGWICTRSNSFGGNCSDGPLPDGECCRKIVPCMPTRSIRGKRDLLVKWSALAVFAILVLALNSDFKAEIFSPGELTFKHAKIEQCNACHDVFDKHFLGWISQALSGRDAIHSSQKCLDCHQFGDNADDAHGLSSVDLKQLTQGGKGLEEKNEKQLACLNCHLEHHGKNFDIADVASQNCAYCHQLDQSIINAKHPEFKQYPYKRNTRIIFDHTTHANKYYYNKAGDKLLKTAPESCLSCHRSDGDGIKMLQNSYDEDCQSCHNEMFEEAESFIVFEIPELAFDSAELNVEWPEDASGSLTNFMIMLLAADSLFIEAVANIEDFHDLSSLNKQNTVKVVKSIKKLFYDIDTQGSIAFKRRMEKNFNCQLNEQGQLDSGSLCEVNKTERESLEKLFPIQLFCEAKNRWFPQLMDEYKKQSKAVSTKSYCDGNNESIALKTEFGDWQIEGLSIEYRPKKHKDIFFKSWLNLSGRALNHTLADKVRLDLFKELSSEDASVQCVKCHSVESSDGNSFRVNWVAKPKDSEQKQFIKFKHNAHIKYQDERVCINCHVANKKAKYIESYEDKDPATFQSNFITESKDCSSCHQPSMVKEQCQLCHNYHVAL